MRFETGLYEHAAKLIGCTPSQVSRDGDLLFQAHAAAYELYQHTPVVVGIDLYNIEAELLGSQVLLPDGDAMPSIGAPIFQSLSDMSRHVDSQPFAGGRVEMMLTAAVKMQQAFPQAQVLVPVTGPFTLASLLLGLENLLMLAIENTEKTEQALQHLSAWLTHYCETIAAHKLNVVVFESAASPPMLSPSMFAEVALSPLRNLLGAAHRCTGDRASCIIGGNTALIAQDLAQSGAGSLICPFETDQEKFLQEIAAFPQIDVRVNVDPRVFLQKNPRLALREAERACHLVHRREMACVGTGVIPFEAEPETVLAVRDFVLSQR